MSAVTSPLGRGDNSIIYNLILPQQQQELSFPSNKLEETRYVIDTTFQPACN